MPQVFLVEQTKRSIDVSKSGEYGEIVYVFGPDDRRSSIFQCKQFGTELLGRLTTLGFNYVKDSICIAGSIVPITVALSAMVCSYPSVNVLFYNSSESCYVQRTIGRNLWKGNTNGVENTKHRIA